MRKLRCVIIAVLCVMMLATTVSANTASKIDNVSYVSSDGTCQVTMTVTIRLDSAAQGLSYPLPGGAKNVTMNGNSARTFKSGNFTMADISYLDNMIGEYTTTFQYSLDSVVRTEIDEKTNEKKMIMDIPLLCGFSYPVSAMSFTVTLPADPIAEPSFYSGYLQQTVESSLQFLATGKIITGSTTQALNDHETLNMTMLVNRDMFPGIIWSTREGNPELIPMLILTVAALAYWIATLRTAPIIRRYRSIPLEGVTAGEMGSRLTMAGGDLTMMVFTWAQLGYIHIHADRRGRIMLYKRMEMGNERGPYENHCFKNLFGNKDAVDATGSYYAKLCLKAAKTVPGIGEMYRRSAGSVKLFRILFCGVSIFSGICLAMNMFTNSVLQILMAIILSVLGIVTAWNIQAGAFRVHIRGKLPMHIGSVCVILWMVLGILAGQWLIALVTVVLQILAGFMAAYGGRRSDLGRYAASQVLGLRHYLKHVSNEELARLADENPDYFFDMLPYAIALGEDDSFAKQYGRLPLPECPYLTTGKKVRHSPEEWARYMRHVADRMDARQRRMQLEKFIIFRLGR